MDETGVDLLFPPRLIPVLRHLRGSAWQDLISNLINREPLDRERLAFIAMMVHMGGCMSCQADSFKAMRGCSQCAILSIRRFRGSDQELLSRYSDSVIEINKYFRED
jgi:hypothetical protein